MAAKVLKSFLIGIGYDTKALEAGDKKIMGSLQGVKSGAVAVSAALVGAFGAAALSITNTANQVDRLALASQNLRTSQATVYNFGSAIKLMGGDAADAVDTLLRFEEIQNNLRLKGDAGPIGDLAMAGLDVSSLYSTETGEEFMRALAGMIPNLDEGQRATVQSALGLSDAVFRSLSGGVESLDASLKKASGLTGSVDQLTEDSRRLAENAAEFGLIIEGVKNELAEKFLPSLIGAGSAINSFLKEYREEIGGAIGYAADNATATAAIGGSSALALTGAAASKIGLRTLGGAASKAGVAGLALSGGAVGSDLLDSTLNEYVPGYGDASRGFDQWLMGVTGLERIPSPMEVLFGSRSAADSMPPPSASPEQERRESAEALAGALARSPIKVESNLSATIQLDGQALEAKIMDVNERTSYETMGDLQKTTER